MSDEVKHECAVAMVVLRRPPSAIGDFGGTKLSLLLEKQHNRGQDGAGAAILHARPVPGEEPYWIAKSASATPLVDVLGAIAKRPYISHRGAETQRDEISTRFKESQNPDNPAGKLCASVPLCEKIFLGHLRYATFGKNEVAFCHPFIHEASELEHTLLLAGNFNLTNAHELFDDYSRHGSFPTSRADSYLICELIAHELASDSSRVEHVNNLPRALSAALANADGAWTFCGATGDGWAFATRDPHGIRPGFYYISDDVVAVASERPAIQAAFDVPPEAVKELPPGKALVVSPTGETTFESLNVSKFESLNPSNPQPLNLSNSQTSQTFKLSNPQTLTPTPRPCSFERIYFSRANDAAIHRERKALGAALVPQILKAADADISNIFFSYIPNSARIAFHGLLEELFSGVFLTGLTGLTRLSGDTSPEPENPVNLVNPVQNNSASLRLCVKKIPRFGEIAVKDAKFRTFIADAAARREFYKHVYDVTYGLVRPGEDTLVVLDDSIVRGNTMKNAILPMLDRLGPKRIVIASSAPPIRYPDCYGIDMSTLGELVAFRALVNLLDKEASSSDKATVNNLGTGSDYALRQALKLSNSQTSQTFKPSNSQTLKPSNPQTFKPSNSQTLKPSNPLAPLYARFTEEQHAAEIARLLTPPGMKAEVKVVYQTVENLRHCLASDSIGDWYFTGDYPTPGGYKVLHKALENYLERNNERSY